MKKSILIISLISIFTIEGKATEICRPENCSNATEINAPYTIRNREIAADIKNIKENGTDKERWSRLALYSESTSPEDLKIQIVKLLKLEMHLDPKNGHLTIEKPGLKHIFQINPPANVDSACPKYEVTIIDASIDHAIIKMICYASKNMHDEYYRSTDYFLYDSKAADMRSIWSAWAEDKGVNLPAPKPIPTIRKKPYGYQLDWTGVNKSDPNQQKYSIHTKYIRKISPDTGKITIQCVDRNDPNGEFTNGPCWARGAKTIFDERASKP